MKDRLFELLYKHSYKKGEFILSSGGVSDFYIDVRPVALSYDGNYLLGVKLAKLVDLFDLKNLDAYAGVVLGGCALAMSIAQLEEVELIFVRKQAKYHGSKPSDFIDKSFNIKGKDVILVEDVITTGESAINAIKALQNDGFCVKGVIAVVDRQEGGKTAIMNETSVLVRSLYTKEDFLLYRGSNE